MLANKIDLGPKITEQELIKGLNLDYIVDNPWLLVPISAKNGTNIEQVSCLVRAPVESSLCSRLCSQALEFLTKHAKY